MIRGAALTVLSLWALSCASTRNPLLASVDAVHRQRATDAVSTPRMIEMPPLYIDASQRYAQIVIRASTDAAALVERTDNCPAVYVHRADHYTRADGTPWTVVRLTACGEGRVYEKIGSEWVDATWRLR